MPCQAKNKTLLSLTAALAALAVVTGGAPADAGSYASDPLVEGAKLCTRQLPRNERKYGIPSHLLSAIASTESGRWHDDLRMALPWPWTINAEGKGYYFDTRQEAVNFASRLRAQGVKSIDVGCMQVNLMHHPDAFASLYDAFEPQANVEYAAKFLKSNFEEDKSWRKAAASYHSRTPEHGDQYIGRVYKSWQRIVDRIRAARLNRDAVNATQTAALAREFSAMEPASASAAAVPAPKKSAYKPVQMRIIQVRRVDAAELRVENGVRVVRPEITVKDSHAPQPIRTAMNADPANFVVGAVTPEPAVQPHIIRMDDKPPASPRARKSGPNFIFN